VKSGRDVDDGPTHTHTSCRTSLTSTSNMGALRNFKVRLISDKFQIKKNCTTEFSLTSTSNMGALRNFKVRLISDKFQIKKNCTTEFLLITNLTHFFMYEYLFI